jgi:putative FmdB family regulatory protein
VPIYEYQCEKCGHEMDALQKMSENSLVTCPECNEDGLKRLVSAAGFRLKGSGWYETDFKHGQNKKDKTKDAKSSSSNSKSEKSSK